VAGAQRHGAPNAGVGDERRRDVGESCSAPQCSTLVPDSPTIGIADAHATSV
jgi:hypothetical protein